MPDQNDLTSPRQVILKVDRSNGLSVLLLFPIAHISFPVFSTLPCKPVYNLVCILPFAKKRKKSVMRNIVFLTGIAVLLIVSPSAASDRIASGIAFLDKAGAAM